jgi:hypothetical protein
MSVTVDRTDGDARTVEGIGRRVDRGTETRSGSCRMEEP